MKRSTHEIDRLLARGGLSGAARETILEQVLESTPRRRATIQRWWYVAAIACGMLAVTPVLIRNTSDDGWRRKGQGAALPVQLECIGASLEACPVGSQLWFRISDVAAERRFVAFATDASKARIWYFPARSPLRSSADRDARSGWSKRAVVIGPEHRPGRFQVHVLDVTDSSSEEVAAAAPVAVFELMVTAQ
jgi:hypothetical protein